MAIYQQLREKLNGSRFEVVHRACNLYAAAGFKVPKHRALFPNVDDSQRHVLSCHSVYERVVFGRALPRVVSGFNGRTDLRQQRREIAKLHPVNGTLDSAAAGVAHDKHDFRACHLASEFHAAQYVLVSNVACHTTTEDIADTKVENQLGGRARVNAAEDNRGRILSLRSRLSFAHEIAMLRFARPEAFVASFHLLDDFVRRHLVALLLGEVCVGQHASQACRYYPDSGRNAGLTKGPAVKSISPIAEL